MKPFFGFVVIIFFSAGVFSMWDLAVKTNNLNNIEKIQIIKAPGEIPIGAKVIWKNGSQKAITLAELLGEYANYSTEIVLKKNWVEVKPDLVSIENRGKLWVPIDTFKKIIPEEKRQKIFGNSSAKKLKK